MEVFKVPRIEGLAVDGSGEDWGSQGLYVAFVTDPRGRALHAKDFDVKFRLGWNASGMFMLAVVSDDVPREHENLSRLWQQDCVEIFLAETVGSANRHQLVITSGADPRFDTARSRLYDHRPEEKRNGKLTSRSATTVLDEGYVVEAWLPWENLGIDVDLGSEVALQFIANDYDGADDPSGGPLRVGWYPGLSSHADSREMYTVRLSHDAGDPILYLYSLSPWLQ
jgi:hypothetical protein